MTEFKEPIEIFINTCDTCQDYREIYINGDLYVSGDEYHRKISIIEKTILDLLDHLEVNYRITRQASECLFYCD